MEVPLPAEDLAYLLSHPWVWIWRLHCGTHPL